MMSEYTEALRRLADLIEAEGFEDVTFHADGSTLSVFQSGWSHRGANKNLTARILKVLGGSWSKSTTGDSMTFTGCALGFQSVHVYVNREAVCERRVVGVETVVIPAQKATKERVEQREVVEWDCGSLLAPAPERELVGA